MNALGISGDPIMVMVNDVLRQRYPVEEDAAAHIRNPHAPRFTPAPTGKERRIVPPSMRPDQAWCTGCQDWHSVACFHKDRTRPNGLQSYCINYRAGRRKTGPVLPLTARRR